MLDHDLVELGIAGPTPRADGDPVRRFPDGGAFRIEIPSVEGPEALAAVFQAADELGLPIHRVSQGSGVMMLTDGEITSMVKLCAERHVELCLFLGPRGSWDIGGAIASPSGGGGVRARGADQVRQSITDAERAVELGVRCLLVGDEGTLWALHEIRAAGRLPSDLRLKVSALIGPSNPASFRVLEGLGADSINVMTDLTVSHLAELRAAGTAAIDVYVESPADLGGFIRYHDAADMVRQAAPVYLKFGIRNAPMIYPAGEHLRSAVLATARERVRRARLCLDLLAREGLADEMSPAGSDTLAPGRRFVSPPV